MDTTVGAPTPRPTRLARLTSTPHLGGYGVGIVTGIAMLLLAVLMLVGCASAPSSDGESFPDSPTGRQAAWVVGVLNDEQEADAAAVEERFSPQFLEQVPADQLLTIFEQLSSGAPWVVSGIAEGATGLEATLTSPTAGALSLSIAVDDAEQIAGLLFAPAEKQRTPAASWQELEERVAAFDAEVSILAMRLAPDGTPTVLAQSGERLQPSGSVVKLVVLDALAQAVSDGDVSWDDTLVVTDGVRSLPSGVLQDEPAGTEVSVYDAALGMISISDNTATDLLIGLVGQDRLSASLEAAGIDAARFDPFLTTRALFQLGWGGDPSTREAWSTGNAAERRALLDAVGDEVLDVTAADVVDPVWTSGLDWEFTNREIAALHIGLASRSDDPAVGEQLRTILSTNPGIPVEAAAWPYVAFKGGSSVGVLAGSWYAEAPDGSALLVVVQGSAETAEQATALGMDQSTFFGLAQDAFVLAAE